MISRTLPPHGLNSSVINNFTVYEARKLRFDNVNQNVYLYGGIIQQKQEVLTYSVYSDLQRFRRCRNIFWNVPTNPGIGILTRNLARKLRIDNVHPKAYLHCGLNEQGLVEI